jgi:hypothetical protein
MTKAGASASETSMKMMPVCSGSGLLSERSEREESEPFCGRRSLAQRAQRRSVRVRRKRAASLGECRGGTPRTAGEVARVQSEHEKMPVCSGSGALNGFEGGGCGRSGQAGVCRGETPRTPPAAGEVARCTRSLARCARSRARCACAHWCGRSRLAQRARRRRVHLRRKRRVGGLSGGDPPPVKPFARGPQSSLALVPARFMCRFAQSPPRP